MLYRKDGENGIPWHTMSPDETLKQLFTSENGLSSASAKKRIDTYGRNELKQRKKTSQIIVFIKQFNSPLIYILLIAMVISYMFDHKTDSYIILLVLAINATIGYAQERKAEKSIEALKKMVISHAKVYRDRELIKIPAAEIVPGDIILLEEGDKIPADCRLIETKNFITQESSLTGESLPVEKHIRILIKEVSIADRKNMVFMSTVAVSGTAKAVVVYTGSSTEVGKIASSIQEVDVDKVSHFKKKSTQLALTMAIFAFVGSLLIYLVATYVNKLGFMDTFFFTIAALVSGIPEGLPAVLSVVLAVGARRMSQKNAVIRHLPAVETFSVVNVIATDKTGTLTQNSMTVEKILTSEGEFTVDGNGWQPIGRFYFEKEIIHPVKYKTLQKLFTISSLCNRGNIMRKDGDYEIIGDPTEVALLVLSKKANIERNELLKTKAVIDEIPFSSDLKFSAAMIEKGKRRYIYTIGAFEKIISNSIYLLKGETKEKISDKEKNDYFKSAENYAKSGYRVVAVAYRDSPPTINSLSKEIVKDLILVGIVAMKDPPRPEVKEAIYRAHQAGIRVIMNTGDHKETAIAISKEIGLVKKNEKALAMSQEELEKLNDAEFKEAVRNVNIFARVTPNMKLRIVTELQAQGNVVAVTGDGVNDAPALKKADIGISMGIIGTDVARESSEVVLTDDNFASIVNAMEEGRIVFRNIKSTSTYLVTTNTAEHLTILSSLLLSLPLPLLPIHILWMNLVTDGFNGFSLSLEKHHETALNSPPKKKEERILDREVIPYLIMVVSIMIIGTLTAFVYFYKNYGIQEAMTSAFIMMTSCQLFSVINMRSMHKSVFKIGFFSNKFILISLTASLIGMFSVIYIPFINSIFKFSPIPFLDLIFIFLFASLVLITGEIYKNIRYEKIKPSNNLE